MKTLQNAQENISVRGIIINSFMQEYYNKY